MTDTHTPAELTRLAEALGIVREEFPEFWSSRQDCLRCHSSCCATWRPRCLECGFDGTPEGQPWYSVLYYEITLPSPLSDSPRAVLWEPFFMRALHWPQVLSWGNGFTCWAGMEMCDGATATAALLRAYEAQNPAWRGEG